MCLSAQTSVITGMMPARLIRSVWRMFLKTTTSLFIKKISVLQTRHAKLMKQCMAMEKTFVRRCGPVPIITQRQMWIILTVWEWMAHNKQDHQQQWMAHNKQNQQQQCLAQFLTQQAKVLLVRLVHCFCWFCLLCLFYNIAFIIHDSQNKY